MSKSISVDRVKRIILDNTPPSEHRWILSKIDQEPAQECERCEKLEQQLTDYLHTSSHKIKDKRIRELEDKIKELEGLLREAIAILETSIYGDFSFFAELRNDYLDKINKALEGK
jgi:hypothetical protein